MEVSLDALISIFSQTVGSLRGAWGMVFAAVVATGYDLASRKVHVALGWALVTSIVLGLARLNRAVISRGAAKLGPGQLVVITGASSGLGLYLTALISRTNPVLALDLQPLPMEISGAHFVRVDCGNEQAVRAALHGALHGALQGALQGARSVHALINCVGIVRGGSTMALESQDIEATLATNFLAPIWATRAVLEAMPSGHLVNISSSTSHVGPRNAGIYAASKAALRVWHEALRQELRHEKPAIKTILVVAGQLDTPMFRHVETPDPFLAPVIRATDLGDEIVRWLRNGWAGEIATPLYVQLLPILVGLLPTSILDLLRKWNGIDRAMEKAR